MLQYLNNFQDGKIVVVSWWDYGYWLTLLGNVTSLTDNATIDTKQIENVGFTFMANETYAVNMLKQYGAKYILVYATFDAGGNWVDWAGGDNGKWSWMADISGNAHDRFIKEGFIDSNSMWTSKDAFGMINNSTGAWDWNSVGFNSTFYKLMSWGKNRWCQVSNGGSDPDAGNVTQPTYFTEEFFSGETLSPDNAKARYRGLVPLVCLYKIDWQKYYSDFLGS
jgi:asparagine N-glycosylation enzyme membrane subunit Stt3